GPTGPVGPHPGYAAAVNPAAPALDMTELDAVFVMNPDSNLRPDTLALLWDALTVPGRGIAVPRLLNPDGTLQPSLRRTPTVRRAFAEAIMGGDLAGRIGTLGALVTDPREYARAGPAAWATGAAMLISVEAMRDIGPWDESFLLYSEETEYALRAADGGWRTWDEAAAVFQHIGGRSGPHPTRA